MKLKTLNAREILDSRGNPTIEVKATLEDGTEGLGLVPSGASTGTHEALELRDGDNNRYRGKGTLKACENVNIKISKALVDQDVSDHAQVDQKMIDLDGTENKSSLGANAILGVSLAIFNAVAKSKEVEPYEYVKENFEKLGGSAEYILPYPLMNIVNGGAHADSGLDIQEYMIIPQTETFAERIRQGAEIFHNLGKILKQADYTTTVGDEGGYAPSLENNDQAWSYIMEAIEKAGYEAGKDVKLAIDAAATEFYNKESKSYHFKSQNKTLNAEELVQMYAEWVEKYPFLSIEDPLDEDDYSGWQKMTEKLGNKIKIVGDDLFVTNIKRLEEGIEKKLANAILIKLNQIGSVTETLQCIKRAFEADFKCIISHRSGETTDTFISDLAVGTGAGFIKTGSLSRGERIAKYNRLMEIEGRLKSGK